MAVTKTTVRRKTPTKRTPVRKTTPRKTTMRRRTTTKKKGMLGELFNPAATESAFRSLVGIGAGYYAGEKFIAATINPDGTKNGLEVGAKLGIGFLVSTLGKMPNVGAGFMASGIKKAFEIAPGGLGLGEAARTNYLNDSQYLNEAKMIPTDIYLNEYTAAYQSQEY